jgi:hypothetical protein
MDNRRLATALFVSEFDDLFDSFIGVAHYPDHGRLLHCLLTNTIKHTEYWRNAADKVTTWTFLKFKILNTRKLNQDALENTFGAISLRCGSNNNPSDALKTAIINGLAYRSLYGTKWEDGGISLLEKLHSFLSHPMLHQEVH